ncbi:hypothetical protein CS022_06270 [Veronia nyctiphanis]|uniref:Energy-coupling factor ABC transporter permease n=1 Tax=Veronia nyctiphanis TaxID=1278244 RepID=A0A4V1LT43_9GAMM|nr:energy-coupling factor ABC transporter permease [Veronia nyctiphanis]RXJ73898.1 hypothetical protein CS022_06270 [Veronia nyctiphanis]
MMIAQVLAWLLCPLVLWLCWSKAGWRKLKSEKDYQHLVFGTTVLMCFLWAAKAGIREGLDLHFLGLAVLTLCHGARIAVWICALLLGLLLMLNFIPLLDGGLFFLLAMVLPALFSYAVFWLSYRYLTHHLFVYIFVAGFFNAGFTLLLHQGLVALWFLLGGLQPWETIWNDYLKLSLLMWFPESLLSGMAVTLMAIYRPQWLRTFYDREYLSPER